jgi:hypothetical protein
MFWIIQHTRYIYIYVCVRERERVSCNREVGEKRLKQKAKGVRFCAGIRRALYIDYLT